ncbi:hypothetical protein AFLA_000982 [Aspergillus flavus NRRL3357]|nr:hypothetical protein AFLA_000982 [Aspergillus flavus NRRL3357]
MSSFMREENQTRLGCKCDRLASLRHNSLGVAVKPICDGLDFLHSECHIIHTDLKADKFLLGFEDSDVLENYARQQESNPAPFRDNDSHPVFQSRPDFGPLRKGMGRVQISDFSAAVFGDIFQAS